MRKLLLKTDKMLIFIALWINLTTKLKVSLENLFNF